MIEKNLALAHRIVKGAMYTFAYGSRVYSTSEADSDWDYISVSDEGADDWSHADDIRFKINNQAFEIHVVSPLAFKEALNAHEISALECVMLPQDMFIGENVNFVLDKVKLRHSVSEKTSHSFVKAKKKILQGDTRPGLKSLFHALRIAEFGRQIAQEGRVINYTIDSDLWYSMRETEADWDILNQKFGPMLKARMGTFRSLAPKN